MLMKSNCIYQFTSKSNESHPQGSKHHIMKPKNYTVNGSSISLWIGSTPSNSHHQDYETFSVLSRKPSNCHCYKLRGVDPMHEHQIFVVHDSRLVHGFIPKNRNGFMQKPQTSTIKTPLANSQIHQMSPSPGDLNIYFPASSLFSSKR